MADLTIPQPLKIELIEAEARPDPGSTEDKIADWAAAVVQLRQIAQWIVGAVIAAIVAIFATSALARIGQMTWAADSARMMAAAAGFAGAIAAIAIVFRYGVRVIVPAGESLQRLSKAAKPTEIRARQFLFELNDLDRDPAKLSDILNSDKPGWKPWIEQLRRTLSFAVVKTRFDELLVALVIALVVAVPAMLLFIWAANPPEGHGSKPTDELVISYDAEGQETGRELTTQVERSGRAVIVRGEPARRTGPAKAEIEAEIAY